eukprot:TRINITY_DN11797_c0_g2_i2.p1 TRINITY_DN11797_c0_g2~~TRINITY_DN11797_c0_g2_i2.p1  ORF type:complete len:756 (+),score=59.76 TRINITY_DN11797_c0_g2_i2:73-2340(+)
MAHVVRVFFVILSCSGFVPSRAAFLARSPAWKLRHGLAHLDRVEAALIDRRNTSDPPGCETACEKSDEECRSACASLKDDMCGTACSALCGDIGKDSGCEDRCEALQLAICPEGVTLPESSVEFVRKLNADPPSQVMNQGEDDPEPVDSESPLWPRALAAFTRGLDAINLQRQNLSLSNISHATARLLHAWVIVEKHEALKLCSKLTVAGEDEYVLIDVAGSLVTGVRPASLIFGSRFTFNTQHTLEQVGAANSLEDDAATRASFPCNPSHTQLLALARKRLGLSRGRFSEGLVGRAYRGGNETLPSEFNIRDVWPMCSFPVRDQGDCGSCYAFAATSLADSRLCIARQKELQRTAKSPPALLLKHGRLEHRRLSTEMSAHFLLTPQELVSCGSADREELYKPYCTLGAGGKSRKYSNGCNGGSTFDALYYTHVYGLPTEECVPYISGGGTFLDHFKNFVNMLVGKVPLCSALEEKACHAGRAQHKLHRPEVIANGDLDGIMRAIYETGPVYASMSIYDDFMQTYPQGFQDDVYVATSKVYLGGHALILDGWGTSPSGTPYWHGQNSWSDWWGLQGYFKIRRGTNEAGIEDEVHFARAVAGPEQAPDSGSGCIKVQQRGDACTLTNVCSSEVRKVKVSYLGSEANCGSWTQTFAEMYPGDAQAVSLSNAHVCTVIQDSHVSDFDSTMYYQDVTKLYPGYSCVLRNTYTGAGKRLRWCGNSYSSVPAGGLAAMPTSMCDAGCLEIAGRSVHETTQH